MDAAICLRYYHSDHVPCVSMQQKKVLNKSQNEPSSGRTRTFLKSSSKGNWVNKATRSPSLRGKSAVLSS